MIKILPSYDLDKIKFATDGPTFKKAVALYESGKVTEFEDTGFTFIATVLGTQSYKVFVSNKKYDVGGCDCYLGKNDTLCKHLVAVAIYAVMGGKKLTDKDKKLQVGGVDDSDGTVGGFMEDMVNMLKEYAKLDSACIKAFFTLKNRETCFGWEEPLLELVKK